MLTYSPYSTDIHRQDLTNQKLDEINRKATTSFFPFSFAVLSDTHAYYRDIQDVIPHINGMKDLSFVLIAGDITDLGLLKEYERGNDLFKRFNAPYLTVIGNHDALSNGKEIYKKLYGPYNLSFVYNNVKFILFNSNKQEFNNNTPDLNWLESELENTDEFHHIIMMSHISIFNRIFPLSTREKFITMVANSNVSLVINGHGHNYEYHELPRLDGGKTIYLINGSVDKRVFNRVDVTVSSVTLEKRLF